MVQAIDRWLSKIPKVGILLMSLVVLGIVGALDSMFGHVLSFALLYLLPIFLMSWGFGRVVGVISAVACAGVWIGFDYVRSSLNLPAADAWNVCTKAAVFIAFAIVVARVKRDVTEQLWLNNELTNALAEVKQLSGLLPICAWCKKIRDSDGQWYNIETFVAEHSEADFSHGICPECAAQRHPAFRM